MIVKKLIQIGNPIIRSKSRAVVDINSKKTQKIIKDLVDSMKHHQLIGIAAPQIGSSVRIFAVEIRKTNLRKNIKKSSDLQIYINPKIIWKSKETSVSYEGCGSVAFANLFGPVKRPKKIKLKAFDAKGRLFKQTIDGLLARVVQHEYDHLNGIVFTDKVLDLKKLMSRDEYIKK